MSRPLLFSLSSNCEPKQPFSSLHHFGCVFCHSNELSGKYIYIFLKSLRVKDYFFLGSGFRDSIPLCQKRHGSGNSSISDGESVRQVVMRWCPWSRGNRNGTLKGPSLAACVSQSPAPQSYSNAKTWACVGTSYIQTTATSVFKYGIWKWMQNPAQETPFYILVLQCNKYPDHHFLMSDDMANDEQAFGYPPNSLRKTSRHT